MIKQKHQSTPTSNSTTCTEPTEEKEPFRFSNSIMTSKVPCDPDDIDQSYNAFFTNKALSQHADCILHVNLLNMYYQQLTPRQNYNYLFHAIRPMKRKYATWGKRVDDERLTIIQTYYNYSPDKARYASSLLSDEQIDYMRGELDEGG